MKLKQFYSLEQKVLQHKEQIKNAPLTAGDILRAIPGKGRSLILVLLCMPFCQPLQIPGLSLPFGLMISFIGLRIVFGKRIWLPKKVLEKKISHRSFKKILDKVLSLDHKIKPLIHPRLLWMSHSLFMEKFNGFIVCLLGLFLALPLPIPLSNLTAAWSIFFIGLGMIEDDGIVIALGYIVTFVTLCFFLYMGVSLKNVIQASF
jgi:hypothetical protein